MDILPKELSNIIIDYKNGMEHQEKFKKSLSIIKNIKIDRQINNENDSMIMSYNNNIFIAYDICSECNNFLFVCSYQNEHFNTESNQYCKCNGPQHHILDCFRKKFIIDL